MRLLQTSFLFKCGLRCDEKKSKKKIYAIFSNLRKRHRNAKKKKQADLVMLTDSMQVIIATRPISTSYDLPEIENQSLA